MKIQRIVLNSPVQVPGLIGIADSIGAQHPEPPIRPWATFEATDLGVLVFVTTTTTTTGTGVRQQQLLVPWSNILAVQLADVDPESAPAPKPVKAKASKPPAKAGDS